MPILAFHLLFYRDMHSKCFFIAILTSLNVFAGQTNSYCKVLLDRNSKTTVIRSVSENQPVRVYKDAQWINGIVEFVFGYFEKTVRVRLGDGTIGELKLNSNELDIRDIHTPELRSSVTWLGKEIEFEYNGEIFRGVALSFDVLNQEVTVGARVDRNFLNSHNRVEIEEKFRETYLLSVNYPIKIVESSEQ
jgi:hypothetical protein